MPDKMRVCAAIVTYNPDIDLFAKVIEAVACQVERVYIYDNASKNIGDVNLLLKKYDNIKTVMALNNDGIAKALNTLCRMALDDNFEFILTLDHDTVICDDFVSECMQIIGEKNVAIVCPRVHYVGFTVKEEGNINDIFTEVEACMTSGSLMSLLAWEKVGGFDEAMFIDWVDNDICTNLRINNYRILRKNDVFMEHKLGNVKVRRFLFWKINDFRYSGMRIYYIVRNGIYFRRKYRKAVNGFKLFLINTYNVLKFLYLNLHNKANRKCVWKGIKDGRKLSLPKK